MRTGKLNEIELKIALSSLKSSGDGIVRGAIIGQDCAIIDCPAGNILLTTDPITCKVADPYSLAITVNSNDIYASGGKPRYAMLTVLAPVDADPIALTESIAKVGRDAREKGIDIVGGHTEFTDAVNRVVISVTMIGFFGENSVVNCQIKQGQEIIVTKYLALEGSRIILENNGKMLDSFAKADIDKLYSQSLSVGDESLLIQSSGVQVASMHDVTEGGVYGAVCELLSATKYGAVLYEDELPVLPITISLSEKLHFDIGKMISSGSMLIIADSSAQIVELCRKGGISATVIGQVTDCKQVRVLRKGGSEEILSVEPDHIYRY